MPLSIALQEAGGCLLVGQGKRCPDEFPALKGDGSPPLAQRPDDLQPAPALGIITGMSVLSRLLRAAVPDQDE
jgi:hypothetical protein